MSVLALRRPANSDDIVFRQMYISISYPELGKLPLLLLLTWDHGLGLLLLFGILTVSIQLLSLQSVSSMATYEKLATTLLFAISVRAACRYCFFSPKDTWLLGVII